MFISAICRQSAVCKCQTPAGEGPNTQRNMAFFPNSILRIRKSHKTVLFFFFFFFGGEGGGGVICRSYLLLNNLQPPPKKSDIIYNHLKKLNNHLQPAQKHLQPLTKNLCHGLAMTPVKTRDIHIHRERILLRTMKGTNIGNFVQGKMLLFGSKACRHRKRRRSRCLFVVDKTWNDLKPPATTYKHTKKKSTTT